MFEHRQNRFLSAPTRQLARLVPPLRAFVGRHRQLATIVDRLIYRFPLVEEAVVGVIRGDPDERYRRWVEAYDSLDDDELSRARAQIDALTRKPRFSLVVACARETPIPERLAQSVARQIYGEWVWEKDFASATGDYVVILDRDIVLRPHALVLFASVIARDPDVLLVYGDDDELDRSGRRSSHCFKPGWNPALLRSQNYFGSVVCIRRSDAVAAGGVGDASDGALWGLWLRATDRAAPKQIRHLPFVISHRLRRPGRPPRRHPEEARHLEAVLMTLGESVELIPVGDASYRTRRRVPQASPLVSIIIPTTCRLDVLRPCVSRLLEDTTYRHFELLLVVNGVDELSGVQRSFIADLSHRANVRALFYDERPYNFSRTNNWAVEQARGELLCFLNDDTEVISPDWLSTMVAEASVEGVAAVGALLLYPNDRIQHAGVILGGGGVAVHTYKGKRRDTPGYHERALVTQDVSCVTAACMVVRREAFSAVGAFDSALGIAFNDVDLCLRLTEAGWRIVWTPDAQLYHKESASIGRHNLGKMRAQWEIEYELMRNRWAQQLDSDPHYSLNLSLDTLEMWQPSFPPRTAYPWRPQPC